MVSPYSHEDIDNDCRELISKFHDIYFPAKSDPQENKTYVVMSIGKFPHWHGHADKYETQLDKNIPVRDSPDFKKYLVKKASLDVVRSFKLYEDSGEFRPELAEKASTLLESIRLDPEAICVYTLALYSAGCGYFAREEYDKAVHFIKMSEKIIEDFKATGKEIPQEILPSKFDVFGSPLNGLKLDKIQCLIESKLFDCYKALKNNQEHAKYAISLIDFYITVPKLNCIRKIKMYLDALIDTHHYAQLNYVLAPMINDLENKRSSLHHRQHNTTFFPGSKIISQI